MTVATTTHILKLSPFISRQFQNHYQFEFGDTETTGMLFGIVDPVGEAQIHYAPPFLPQISPSLRQHDYAYGRYEASIEAAYQLNRWVNLGYWLAYQGIERSPEEVLLLLNGSVGGEMSLPEQLILTLRRTPINITEVRAYTFISSRPLTGWRELTIIH